MAASTATFGLTEVIRGIIPGGGGVSRLPYPMPRLPGHGDPAVGDHRSADEAHRIGPVNRVVAPEAVEATAGELAGRVAGNRPLAVQAVTQAVRRSDGIPLADALRIESEVDVDVEVFAAEDALKGSRAFMEKRPPRFTGR